MKAMVAGIALLSSGFGLASAAAAARPTVDVPEMVQASDLIVVGRAERIKIERRAGDVTQSVHVSVARVLKSADSSTPLRVSVALEVVRSGHDPGHASIAERQYGIFFLKRSHPGDSYTATDPYHPVLVASPRHVAGNSGDPLTEVVDELTRVLATAGAALTDPRHGLQKLPTGTAAEQAGYAYREAAAALRSIPYAQTGSRLHALAASDELSTKLWAIVCLLQTRGPDRLASLKGRYLEAVAPVLMNPSRDLAHVASALAYAMEGNITTPKAVPTLTRLLDSSDPTVRAAAASVLASIENAR